MRERPILFSAPMVRAILDGSKTQTRRICKPQPFDRSYSKRDHRIAYASGRAADGDEIDGFYAYSASSGGQWQVKCPHGQPGDRLWVRETWSTHACFDHVPPAQLTTLSLHYWADGEIQTGKKRPSIHMPRWASRITLEVTGVRVEQLQTISHDDALAEGVANFAATLNDEPHPSGESPEQVSQRLQWPQRQFRELWESISGPGSWDANPWVWIVEFKRVAEERKS